MKVAALLVLALAACAASNRAPTAVTKIVADNPACRGMDKFQAQHVEAFFLKAKDISSKQADGYSVLPCEVHGRTVLNGEKVQFVLKPFGVADVTDKDGETKLYGCDDCSELFPPH